MRRLLRLAPTLTAVGFGLGVVGHACEFVLATLAVIPSPPHYPPWRHAIMACVDAVIATVGIRRPRLLMFVLTPFLVEQVWTNGWFVFTEWLDHGAIHGYLLFMLAIEAAATCLAAANVRRTDLL